MTVYIIVNKNIIIKYVNKNMNKHLKVVLTQANKL